jgi:hypothetical protein
MGKQLKTKRKYTRKEQATQNSGALNVFTSDHMLSVFGDVENILEASLMPYTYLGNFAKQLHDGSLDISGSEFQIAILKKDYSDHGFDILKYHVPDITKEDHIIKFERQGVPITIYIVDKDYGFLHRPDFKFFYTSNCRIPNPFEKYWEVRALFR